MKNADWENWVNVALGIWIILTPWSVSHGLGPEIMGPASWNFWIVGFAITLVAALALRDIRPWEEWTNAALGIWLLFSPWLFGYTASAALTWNSVVAGLIVASVAALALPVANRRQLRPR